jgi:hypothetical protein
MPLGYTNLNSLEITPAAGVGTSNASVLYERDLLSQQPGPFKTPLAGNNACAAFRNQARATATNSEQIVITHQPGQTLPNKDKFVQSATHTGAKGTNHTVYVNRTAINGSAPAAQLDLSQVTINARCSDGSELAKANLRDQLALVAALLSDPTFVAQWLSNQI